MKNLLILLVPAVLVFTSCMDDQKPPSAKIDLGALTKVETFVVQPTELKNEITTHGSILPNEMVELKAEIAGRIVNISFREGTFVQKGQVLVQIDKSELVPQLEKSKAQLEIAQNDLERKKELIEVQGVSQEELENAEIRLAELQAEISLIEARIRKSAIIAPFSGKVGLRDVSPGAFVGVGDRIAKLVQTNPVKINFSISETQANMIGEGTKLDFTLANDNRTWQAEVYAVEPAIDRASRALQVRAVADNPEGVLVPGAFVELSATLQKIKGGLMVPTIAVTQDIEGQKVFIIENGKARSVLVTTGIQRNSHIQVTEGIEPGDTLITTGLLSMKDGMTVEAKKVEMLKDSTQAQ